MSIRFKDIVGLGFWVLSVSFNGVAQSPKTSYTQVLYHIKTQQSEWTRNDSAEISEVLFTTLVDSIFPEWYGTVWDFNGISNTPGKGEIACGYFVSTTLKHCGFNLNRYKLAQQASAVITQEVCGIDQTVKCIGMDKALTYLSAFEKGLFIVGLDYHVGFIVIENSEVFFVHSDYINGMVVREKLAVSEAFQSSQVFVIGKVLPNSMVINKWLSETKVY
jgi:hypothetical protein